MKSKNIIIFVVIAVFLTVFALLKVSGVFGNGMNYDDIKVYKNNVQVSFNGEDKEQIKNHLKNEKLNKIENTCTVNNTYLITFNNISLSFDDSNCGAYLKNNNTEENYYTTISNELKNYIINITN